MVLSLLSQLALAQEPALARHPARLGTTVAPSSQVVSLAVDPAKPAYTGHTEIALRVPTPTRSFTLHADEMTLGTVVLRRKRREIEATATPLAHGLVRIDTRKPIKRGEWTVALQFTGELRTEPYGLYRFERDGRWYVVSQFEADDARTAWPCFDEPAFKIPLRLSVDVPEGLAAIGNSPVETDHTANGVRSVGFAETPPIPMYAAALAVGPYVGTPVEGLPYPSTVWAVTGQERYAGGVVEALPAITRWLTDWFGSPMPYAKLDIIAVPEFAFGAMENPGAIVMTDTLLADPAHQTDEQRQLMRHVVAHEVAHLWFGDWVTLAWWDDLWLNESFADWVSIQAETVLDPGGRGEMSEVAAGSVMIAQDGRASVRPLRTEVDPAAVFETVNFAVYDKGRLVLAMVESWLGADAFREGLRQYLAAHPYGTATSSDLFDALSAASGKDVRAVMLPYLDTPGVPQITFAHTSDGRLKLTQRRYAVRGSTPTSGGPWVVPVRMRVGRADGTSEIVTVLLDGPSVEVDPGAAEWILPAADGVGYYTWSLPDDLRTALVRATPDLSPPERLRVVDALRLEHDAGEISLADVLQAVPSFAGDSDARVLRAVLGLVERVELAEHLADPDLEARADAWRRTRARAWIAEIGLDDVPGESTDRAELRRRLLGTLADAGDPEIRKHARTVGERFLADPTSVDGDLGAWGLRVLAEDDGTIAGSAPLQPRLVAGLATSNDPAVRQVLLRAIGQVRGDAARDAARALAMSPELSSSDTFAITTGIRDTRESEAELDEALAWTLANYDRLSSRVPPVFRPYIASAAGGCSPERLARGRSFFLDPVRNVPGTEQVLAEVDDAVRMCRLEIETDGPGLAPFLRGTPAAAAGTVDP